MPAALPLLQDAHNARLAVCVYGAERFVLSLGCGRFLVRSIKTCTDARLSIHHPYLITSPHYAAGEHLRIHADARHGLPQRRDHHVVLLRHSTENAGVERQDALRQRRPDASWTRE